MWSYFDSHKIPVFYRYNTWPDFAIHLHNNSSRSAFLLAVRHPACWVGGPCSVDTDQETPFAENAFAERPYSLPLELTF